MAKRHQTLRMIYGCAEIDSAICVWPLSSFLDRQVSAKQSCRTLFIAFSSLCQIHKHGTTMMDHVSTKKKKTPCQFPPTSHLSTCDGLYLFIPMKNRHNDINLLFLPPLVCERICWPRTVIEDGFDDSMLHPLGF